MGTYKGNKGNLMQHWTLCEVLSVAWDSGVRALNYIDAHAMAPLATVRTGSDNSFDRVCESLPGQCSTYELAWRKLSPIGVDWYPSSANFVRQIWKGDYSLLLCEQDAGIAADIGRWLRDVKRIRRCKKAQCHLGDWSGRFEEGLPQPRNVGLGWNSLTYISFDPYMISNSVSAPHECPGYLYPSDLAVIGRTTGKLGGAVLMQLSTYSKGRSKENSQSKVIQSADAVLTTLAGFSRAAVVKANREMMSLIYTRNVDWCRTLAELPTRFTEWLKPFKR